MMNETTDLLLKEILALIKPRQTFPYFYSSTTTGTVAAGTIKISFTNSGGANVTITSNGTSYTLEPDEILDLDPGMNRVNNIITFDATGSTLKYVIYY